MKRSHETFKRSYNNQSSSGGGCDAPKDEPLKTENDAFVRSILRFIDDGGTEDTSDDDILDEERLRRHGDGVKISKHVASAWKNIDGYYRYSRSHYDGGCERTIANPPTQDAKLEAISVFYKVSDVEHGQPGTYEIYKVDAFMFHFSDGGELDSHELIRAEAIAYQNSLKQKKEREQNNWFNAETKKLKCGKLRVLIPLVDMGEIRTVTAHWKRHRPGYQEFRILTGISLKTSTGKVLRVTMAGYCEEREETPIPEGQTLRSIQINPDHRDLKRIFHVETSPIKEDKVNKAPTPPLSILAHRAEVDRLQNKATYVEDNAKKTLKRLREETNKSIDDIVKHTRTSIQSSPEAAEVRRLNEELAAAKGRLQDRSWKECKAMVEEIKEVKSKNEQSRLAAKTKWSEDRNNVLNEHESYLKRVVDLHIDCGVTATNDICKFPHCRRVYQAEQLQQYKLCSIKNCSTNKVTCGCSVKLCNRCSSFLCIDHMVLHKKHCKEEEDRLLLEKHKYEFEKEKNTEPRLSLLVIQEKTEQCLEEVEKIKTVK